MKNRIWLLIIAIVLILGFFNGIKYWKNQPLQSGQTSTGTVMAQEIDVSSGIARDKKRLKDVTLIRYGLGLFKDSHGRYPNRLEEMSSFINQIPNDPLENWLNYTYVPIADRTTYYVISYGLEEGYAGIDYGEHRATEKKLSNDDIDWAGFDSDGDGIDDNIELKIYWTNPHDLDTDDDGYTDGEEVYNGYNPLGI